MLRLLCGSFFEIKEAISSQRIIHVLLGIELYVVSSHRGVDLLRL